MLDGLVKRLQELEKVASMYRGMMDHTKTLLKGFFDLAQAYKGTRCCISMDAVSAIVIVPLHFCSMDPRCCVMSFCMTVP